ncbi:MAG TPA: hypothetical protein VLL57_03095, partial [Candidatus Binataceae bacterium]|nr:hypothetical protein [Candidatus Binataceae bacterium]
MPPHPTVSDRSAALNLPITDKALAPSASGGSPTLLDLFNQFANLASEYLVYDDGYRSWSYRYDEIAGASRAF